MSDSNKYANVDYRLKNLTNALYLTDTNDVAVRTGIQGNIIIEGNVNIPGTITVESTPEEPVHTHVTEIGTSGILAIPNMPVSIQDASGNQNAAGHPVYVAANVTGGNVNANVTGSVTITSLPEVEIKNDSGNPISVSRNTSTNSNVNPIFVQGVGDMSFFSPVQNDAFGRLRVSNPQTIADSFNRYRDNGQYAYSTTGSGATGYDANNAAITLSVGSGATDAAYAETEVVYAYQPGKSLLVMQTFTFAPTNSVLTQRAGYFDAGNGIYLEQVGTTINLVRRTSVSGSMSETRVEKSTWNVNTLPGLDLTKSQIFWMDLEWLGVGSVRCGFVIDEQFVLCHTFKHSNVITGVYMTTACLPVRKEIFNTGSSSGTSTMKVICHTVISEGGYSVTGRSGCIGHTLGSPVALPIDQSLKPVFAMRLKSTNLNSIVLPSTISIVPVQQAIYKFQIYTHAVTAGGSWVSAGTNSSVEYNLGPTSLSSGTIVNSGFMNTTNQSGGALVNSILPFRYQLERNSFNATAYEIVVEVATTSNTGSCYVAINWEEVA